MGIIYPAPFLEVRVQFLDIPPTVGLCAGYEGGEWRCARLADHLFQWLPYAALSQDFQQAFASHNFVEMLRVAAAHIYNTKKTASRGELGELLLHIACIEHVGTVPIVCKLILKSSSNDTVKGFDGIHILPAGGKYELWLGESKFYQDPKRAIVDAIDSIKAHVLPSFLAAEKAMILGHVAQDVPFRSDLVKLFQQQTSGDKLLEVAVFPILIAYDSDAVQGHTSVSADYIAALKAEVGTLKTVFMEKSANANLRFHLIFVPLKKKVELIVHFDKLLEPFL
jgi:hypothetical protein